MLTRRRKLLKSVNKNQRYRRKYISGLVVRFTGYVCDVNLIDFYKNYYRHEHPGGSFRIHCVGLPLTVQYCALRWCTASRLFALNNVSSFAALMRKLM